MGDSVSLLTSVKAFAEGDWINGSSKWIQLYPYSTWDHPIYGKTTIDEVVAHQLKDNFDQRVKDQHVFTDYEHGLDPAKGNKSSGELLEVEVKDDGLWGFVKFTPTAKEEIEAGEWNYWSTSHYDTWTHPHTEEKYSYVLDGGALTNKPYVKGMIPLNFSEIMIENPEFAEKKKKTAPYGNVTYADPGYRSDNKKRYPLDTETHIRAAWSYINMPKNAKFYTSSQLASIKKKIKAAMSRIGAAVKSSELVTEEELEGPVAEMAPEEHQEPLEGPDYSINEDDSAGSRLDTPPEGEDGTVPSRSDTVTSKGGQGSMTPEEILAALREKLGINDDIDVVSHVEGMTAELEPLRELKKQHSEQKRFGEMFPEEFARMQKLEERDRERVVKQFTDSLAARRFSRATGEKDAEDNPKLEATTYGLSALAVEEIGGLVKKFNEQSASLGDFSDVMDTVFDGGIVDYGNKGSELSPPEEDRATLTAASNLEGRKLFAEKVNEIVKNDELEFDAALKLAVERYPALYEQYLSPVTAK